jgi:integrase
MKHERYNGGVIRPRGTKWQAEINRGGKRRKVCPTVEQCRNWIDAEQLISHREVAPPKMTDMVDADDARKILGNVSLRDAARYWMEHHRKNALAGSTIKDLYTRYLVEKTDAGLRPRSLCGIRSNVGRLATRYGSTPVSEITPTLLVDYLGTLHAKPVSRNTLRRYWWGFFDHCRRLGSIMDNPAEAIAVSRVDDTMPEIFTPDQAQMVITAAGRLRPFIAIGLFAGLRTAELLALKWGDISATHIRIVPAVAKKRRQRLIPISDTLRPLIANRGANDERVCPVQERRLYVILRKIAKKAEMKEWPSNAMRHSFASYHLALYQDAAKTAMLLGHSQNASVLWDNYRELVTEDDARRYFAITC